jgi:ApaG protein
MKDEGLPHPTRMRLQNGSGYVILENPHMTAYTQTTEGITVTASPVYLDGQSDSMEKKFVFAYFIRIENHRSESVQLLRRHWVITDSDGNTKEVEGEGVVGKKPVISPGEAHQYNSFSIIKTFEGYMEGSYLMESGTGKQFRVAIPRFVLRASAN